MSLSTCNIYGNIFISDDAVSMLVSHVTAECYGVVELVSKRLSDSVLILFNRVPVSKGVKIVTIDNKIYVDLYVILKEGVNRDAVINSLKKTVEYHVGQFTGMIVKSVDVHVVGVK